MNNKLFSLYILCFFLLNDFIIFAQGDGNEDGDLENPDPALPIDGKLLWLGIIGIIFAFYIYRSKTKEVL
jgi:Zn-dependent protease with chaperone function